MAQQSEKKETRFDKRVNWIKDHKFFSWVLLIAFIVAPLVTIITVYGDTAPRIKNFVRDIKSIGDPEVQPALKTIRQYYDDQATGSVVVSDYFAPQVEQFITLKNPTHEEIQSSFISGREDFSNPEMKILDSTFFFSKDPSGNESVDFWGAFTCYRKTKKKYQSCLVRVAFVFDQEGKIKSLAELQQKNLKFYNKAIQMAGTVGKLSAVFNLTFDYEKNKVVGTYITHHEKALFTVSTERSAEPV